MTIDFKGSRYPKSVVLYAAFFYVRYGVSYRYLEEIMAERGVDVDHATLNRWVVKYAAQIAANAQAEKRPTACSWRMDETYIKVRGKWTYLYRVTCAPSSLQLGAESLVLNFWRYAAILSIKFLCKNSIGVRFPSAECGLCQL